jgi:MEMO1 family protein
MIKAVKHFTVCALTLAGLALPVYGEENMNTNTTRQIRGAMWFPDDPALLQKTVNGFMDKANVPAVTGRIAAAIAPHAGIKFSGPVAAHTFRAIRDNFAGTNRPDTVVILGFTHQMPFPGMALLDGSAIETAIGKSAIDTEGCELLVKHTPRIRMDARPHEIEHSAKNLLPFAQTALPDSRFIIGLIGDHDIRTSDDIAAALAKLAEKKSIVVVASTDLLHDPDYDLVTKTDKETLEQIAAMNTDRLTLLWTPKKQICCGIMTVLTAVKFAATQGVKQGTLLHYRNSGDDFPESRGQWVVGYGAMVFTVTKQQE